MLMASVRLSMFWIKGKPGSGKSTLLSFMYSNQNFYHKFGTGRSQSNYQHRRPKYLRHFFWYQGSTLQKNLSGFLRSVLWQSFTDVRETGMEIWNRHVASAGESTTLSIQVLRTLLHDVLADPTYAFIFIIDALDKCQDRDAMLNLIRSLEAM